MIDRREFFVIIERDRVVTVPVHPGQDISRGLLRKILRDADITPDELRDLLK